MQDPREMERCRLDVVGGGGMGRGEVSGHRIDDGGEKGLGGGGGRGEFDGSRYSFELRFQGERNGDGHIGYAWMLFDPANAVVSQDDKYVGQGMSWHVAEYTALLEGLTVARSLNLKHIVAYGTSRIVCNQVRYDVFLTDFFWFPAAYSVAGTDMNAKYPRGPTRGCIDQ